jgi:hypothetical protein
VPAATTRQLISDRRGQCRAFVAYGEPTVEYVLIGGLAVGARVCLRADLIAMKRAAGRSQDLLDLEQPRRVLTSATSHATSGMGHGRARVHPRSFVSRDA